MTAELFRWAQQQKVGCPSAKAVLMQLAWFASRNGHCTKSQDDLAGLLDVHKKTVERAVKKLVADGYVTSQRRVDKRGFRVANCYVIQADHQSLGPTRLRDVPAQTVSRSRLTDRQSQQSSSSPTESQKQESEVIEVGLVERSSPTTTLRARGDVAASSSSADLDSRQCLIVDLAELLRPTTADVGLAEKIITAQVRQFGEPTVKTALGRLKTRAVTGGEIRKPGVLLNRICEDVVAERNERQPNRHASHGVSRF